MGGRTRSKRLQHQRRRLLSAAGHCLVLRQATDTKCSPKLGDCIAMTLLPIFSSSLQPHRPRTTTVSGCEQNDGRPSKFNPIPPPPPPLPPLRRPLCLMMRRAPTVCVFHCLIMRRPLGVLSAAGKRYRVFSRFFRKGGG